jgi:hypothetical protein
MPESPSELYSPEPNALERRAAGFLARRSAGERRLEGAAALRRTTRRAVGLAAAAGIVSGGLIGGSEIWLRQEVALDELDFWEALPWWIGWFAVAGVISAIEIAFLYWLALRGVARIVGTADVGLDGEGYPTLFARGFARGALEFPNPKTTIYGVDPYAYVPGWRLVVRTVAYKLKVGVSSFILRVFLRRVATRLAVRGIIPLLAGPLYAAWNAFIIWRIITEARLRAYGPAAIDAMIDALFSRDGPSEAAREAVLHGAGEMTRCAADAHPNYVYLLARLREALGIDGEPEIRCDWDGARDRLGELEGEERDRVLGFLLLVAVLGTRTRSRQRRLVDDAFEAAGVRRASGAFKRLRRRLSEGALAAPDVLDGAQEKRAAA